MDESLRFYREGLGLVVASDQYVTGDLSVPFKVSCRRLRAVQLAHAEDVTVGLVELVAFEDGVDRSAVPAHRPPYRGPWLISFRCEFDATVQRLSAHGYQASITSPEHNDPGIELRVGTVIGPDGELVELMPAELRVTSVRLAERGTVGLV
jgi:glyoxylase I family protein